MILITFNLPGFTTSYMKNRKKSRRVKSGGIFVAIKDTISEYFCLVEGNSSELVLSYKKKRNYLIPING